MGLLQESVNQPAKSAGVTDESDQIKAVKAMVESKRRSDVKEETPEYTIGEVTVTESIPESVSQDHSSCSRVLGAGIAGEEAPPNAAEYEKDTPRNEAVENLMDKPGVVSPKLVEETVPGTEDTPVAQTSPVPCTRESSSDLQEDHCQGDVTHTMDNPLLDDVKPEPQPAAMETDSPVKEAEILESGEQQFVLAFDSDKQRLVFSPGECLKPVAADKKDTDCSEPVPTDVAAEKMDISDDGAEH